MKRLTWLLLALLLTNPLMADTSDQIITLSKEKSKLTREGMKLLRKHKVDPHKNSHYEAAYKKALASSTAFIKLRNDHPKIKPLAEEGNKLLSKMTSKEVRKDKAARKVLLKEYAQKQREIQKIVAGIPNLVKAQKKASKENATVKKIKLSLISDLPEGEKYLKKIQALEKKIAKLQQSL